MAGIDQLPQGKKKQKKGWFKKFLERLAKENQESGGKICAA